MNFFIILLNRTIDILKYPVALVAVLLTFELFHVLYEVLEYVYVHLEFYKDFFMGMLAYMVSWALIFRKIRGNWFLVIEHELTHALFALLTFHRMNFLLVTADRGGVVNYSGAGNGNWLITIAPYFFPTFSMIIILFISFSEVQHYPVLMILLGYTFFYHIHSTIEETSHTQPDLKKVGLWFSWSFLPAANLLTIIGILSAIPNDRIEFLRTLEHLYAYLLVHLSDILKLIIY